MPLSRASHRSQGPVYQPGRTGQAVVINKKDVEKHLKSLPDVADKAAPMQLDDEDDDVDAAE